MSGLLHGRVDGSLQPASHPDHSDIWMVAGGFAHFQPLGNISDTGTFTTGERVSGR